MPASRKIPPRELIWERDQTCVWCSQEVLRTEACTSKLFNKTQYPGGFHNLFNWVLSCKDCHGHNYNNPGFYAWHQSKTKSVRFEVLDACFSKLAEEPELEKLVQAERDLLRGERSFSKSRNGKKRMRGIRRLVKRDGAECVWCRTPLMVSSVDSTRDHLIPASQGGSGEISNLVLACSDCNNLRSDQSVSEFAMKMPKAHLEVLVDCLRFQAFQGQVQNKNKPKRSQRQIRLTAKEQLALIKQNPRWKCQITIAKAKPDPLGQGQGLCQTDCARQSI